MSEEPVVHTERKFVTAALAQNWLKCNIDNNRPLNQERINQYARDMRAGRWKENGDTIKFAVGGALIDGQHRLQACVVSGVGFWALIAYGINPDAFMTIDRNQVRSTGQLLHLSSGVSDYNQLAATLSWLWRFRDGIMLAQRHPTSIESAELLQTHPQLKDSVAAAKKILTRFKAGPCAIVSVCHYLFSRQDATLAELFFDALGSGANLKETDPVYSLRQRIINQGSSRSAKITNHELVALYFKAWIAEREQRPVKSVLKWASTETFPNIGPIDESGNKHRPDKIAPKTRKSKVADAHV